MDAKRHKLSYYQAIDPPNAELVGKQRTQKQWDDIEWDNPDPVTLAYSSDGHVYRHIRPPAEPLNEEVSIGSGTYNVVYARTDPLLVYRVLKYPTPLSASRRTDFPAFRAALRLPMACPTSIPKRLSTAALCRTTSQTGSNGSCTPPPSQRAALRCKLRLINHHSLRISVIM